MVVEKAFWPPIHLKYFIKICYFFVAQLKIEVICYVVNAFLAYFCNTIFVCNFQSIKVFLSKVHNYMTMEYLDDHYKS